LDEIIRSQGIQNKDRSSRRLANIFYTHKQLYYLQLFYHTKNIVTSIYLNHQNEFCKTDNGFGIWAPVMCVRWRVRVSAVYDACRLIKYYNNKIMIVKGTYNIMYIEQCRHVSSADQIYFNNAVLYYMFSSVS